jgi:putative ATPase subunit of terminase (gpP-like)
MDILADKKKEFQKLFLTGKYTQKEIADMIQVSRVTINQWVKDYPVTTYIRVRKSLAKELERLSKTPKGNEEMIFKYIQHLDLLDKMIRKAKYLPKV